MGADLALIRCIRPSNMIVSKSRGPQYRPANARMLMMKTPNFGKPPHWSLEYLSLRYREQDGIKSFLLDDDGCDTWPEIEQVVISVFSAELHGNIREPS